MYIDTHRPKHRLRWWRMKPGTIWYKDGVFYIWDNTTGVSVWDLSPWPGKSHRKAL